MGFVSQVWRSWKSAKSVALLATVALAIGIGSTTAIYTVIDAVLLKPLPYEHGDRWVALFGARLNESGVNGLSYPDLLKFQQRSHSFDVFGWYSLLAPFNLTSPGQPQFINGVEVTPYLVNNLGVRPALGRWFHEVTQEPNGPYVAVISHALWSRLGSDPSIIGKAITLNDRQYTVTGVMPPWFRLPIAGVSGEETADDVWVPIDPRGKENNERGVYLGYARLRPNVTLPQAEAEIKGIAAQIAREDPGNHPSYTAVLFSLRDAVVRDIRPTLLLLFGAAALLLLITCANVAGLLVARSISRARETAVRVALGAARRQLALQYFLEGLLVSLGGAALGILLSIALVRTFVSLAAQFIPRADEINVNWSVLLFALVVGCLASLLASQAPLWQALRTTPNEVLNEGVRASAGARSRRLAHVLVIAEITLAFTLLSVSALLITQLTTLLHTWPGFDTGHLLTFQLTASGTKYSGSGRTIAYQNRLLEALNAIPGVTSTALVNQMALVGCCFVSRLYPEGRTLSPRVSREISILTVSPRYFETMRIPLRRGRYLNEHDTSEKLIPIVINQAAASYYWPDRDTLGAYVRLGDVNGDRAQVVGIVGNVRNKGLGDPTQTEFYLLNAIAPPNPMWFVVRSPVPEQTLVPEIRAAIRRIDPAQPIYSIMRMSEIVQTSVTIQRVSSSMSAFFAASALLMAVLGVYGLMSYSVRQRTVEIGTRMALGAVRSDLLKLVLGDGAKLAGFGLLTGSAASALTTWVLVNRFGVHSLEWVAFVSSVLILAAVTMLASFFPAWRATLLSPMVAIRNEPTSMWESAQRGMHRISDMVFGNGNVSGVADSPLLAAIVDATRGAGSFSEALHLALATVVDRIECETAILLEKIPGPEYRCVAVVPDSGDNNRCPAIRGYLPSRFRFYNWPLPLSESDLTASLQWATAQKPEYVTEIEGLTKARIRLAVPLWSKKDIFGLLLLGPAIGRSQYSEQEKQMLRVYAEQLALLLENGRLTERVLEQEKLRRDLALAVEVQRRLLPDKPPESGAAELAAISIPARSVGGDYYDFIDLGEHCLGVALADVAGKGISAALIMSIVHTALRIVSSEANLSLPELAAKMNRFLYRSTRSNSYATFFFAQLDEQNRQLRYVNAGHNPPYVVRFNRVLDHENAKIEELSTGGLVIGMFPQAGYEEGRIDLNPGDVLMAFTDGVPEALSPNEEEFGEEQLRELLRILSPLPAREMASRIAQNLKDWIRDAPQHDDITFVLMKMN